MNEWTILVGLIALMVLALGIVAVIQKKKQQEIRVNHPGYPKGYWMEQGIGMGVALGAGIGVALQNIAIGIGIGIAIGTAIGLEREQKHKAEVRPLTDEERRLRKQTLMLIGGILVSGIVLFLLIFFLFS